MIKNKLKLGLSALAVFLMLGMASSANAAALTWTADQTVDLSSPDINLTIVSGSKATSLVVGTGDIIVVVASGDVFTVTSASRALSVTGDSTSGVANTCTSGVATVVITGDAETITISPIGSAACADGGGGGGGGGSKKTTTPVTPAVPANEETPEGCLPGYQFSPLTGRNCNAATPAVPTVCPQGHLFSGTTGQACTSFTPPGLAVAQAAGGNAYAFGTLTIKMGSKGEACRAWQMFLNEKASAKLVADGWCGKLTISSAKAWQASVGLTADGLLGPMSRSKAMMQSI